MVYFYKNGIKSFAYIDILRKTCYNVSTNRFFMVKVWVEVVNLISKIYFFYINKTTKQRVVIPKWIKEIPFGAFKGNYNISEVWIPEAVQRIGKYAFSDCDSLEKVYFNGSVKTISRLAFAKTNNISFIFAAPIKEKDKYRMLTAVRNESTKSAAKSSDADLTKASENEVCDKLQSEAYEKGRITADNISVKASDEIEEVLNVSASQEPVENEPAAELKDIAAINDIVISEDPETAAEFAEIKTGALEEDEAEKIDEIENFDEIILPKRSCSPSEKPSVVARNKKETIDNKADIRKRDLAKYASKISITDVRSSDPFVSLLIDKYSVLENKYGNELPLGMIDITKDEYEKLVRYVYSYITAGTQVGVVTAFMCSVFLVKTVVNYDHNNNFWGTVSVLLKIEESTVAHYLKEALLYFCSSEKLYFHYYKTRHSYARTVLIHSMINRSTLYAVINFIRDFYIEEMRESYDPALIQKFIDIFVEKMVSDIEKGADEKSVDKDMGGIYKVSLAFKTACREFPSAVKDGLKCLFFNLDAYYHRTSDVSYSPAVFNKFFKRWKIIDIMQKHQSSDVTEQKSRKTTTKAERKNNEQIERLARLQRCTYYIDENYRLNLYIPQQVIPEEYAQDSVYIRLFDNDKHISEYDRECDVFGMFRFHTGEVQIELGAFYEKLGVRIVTENNTVIFDSKLMLYRNHIVFDSDLDEYIGRTIPKERFYVLNDKKHDFFADANYNSYKHANYVVHSLDVDGKCELLVDSQNVFDNSDVSADVKLIIDSSRRVQRVKAYAFGKEYRVYSSLPLIRCISENDNADKYMLDINDHHINVSELLGENSESLLDIKKILNVGKLSFVSIYLREKGSKKHLQKLEIAVLEDFEYSLDKPYYYTEKEGTLLDLYASDVEFEIEEYPHPFAVNSSRRITVNGAADDIQFYLDIRYPIIYWEFDEEHNSLSGTKYIPSSIFEKNSNIIIDLSVGNCSIWAVNDTTQRQLSVVNGRLDLSAFKVSASDFTTIGVKGDNIGEHKLFELIHRPSVREMSVSCSDNELCISYIQIGKCSLKLLLKNNSGDIVFTESYPPKEDGIVIIAEDISELSNGIYIAEVAQIIADDFGFSTVEKMIGTFTITKGNVFEIYCQSKRGILKPYYCVLEGDTKKRTHNFYCENINSSDNGESGVYVADAFYHNRNGDRVYLVDANPVHIELLEKTGNVITFTITDNDGDGFLYEKARGYLCCDKIGIRDYDAYSLPDHYAIKI